MTEATKKRLEDLGVVSFADIPDEELLNEALDAIDDVMNSDDYKKAVAEIKKSGS